MVPSCCLIWHSSCKASLFTILNLSQVVILKLEHCGFLFLKAYSVFHNYVFFIFLNLKILCFVFGAKLLPNFKWLSCKVSFVTLWNASEVTILKLDRCVFCILKFILIIFIFIFPIRKFLILLSIRGLFSFLFRNFQKIYFLNFF